MVVQVITTMNIRETSLTVSGFFGSVLMGRSLSIHQSNAILNDMTLFGVGVNSGNIAGTTLGRIGVGYVTLTGTHKLLGQLQVLVQ